LRRGSGSTTRSPFSDAASAWDVPNPPGVPRVMNQVLIDVLLRFDDQPRDAPIAQREPEVEVNDGAGKVAFQVVDGIEVVVVEAARGSERARVRVFAG
jgi:hypothetical protein